MAYYIRKNNLVYKGGDAEHGIEWAKITPTTTILVVAVFPTRNDAKTVLATLNDDLATIDNGLDYK